MRPVERNNGSYKIFDSHARDEYSRSHPSGTCALLEEGGVGAY